MFAKVDVDTDMPKAEINGLVGHPTQIGNAAYHLLIYSRSR